MNSNESLTVSNKTFLNSLNKFLRTHGYYINFTDGTLYHISQGYLGALEDTRNCLYLVQEDTGETIYESKTDDNDK